MIFKDFKTTVFTICNELNNVVIQFYEAGITPNFYVAHIKKNDNNF